LRVKHRYGKVITKCDRLPDQGCSLDEKDRGWCFVDECGDVMAVEAVDSQEEKNIVFRD
jgi:hypothetical protein